MEGNIFTIKQSQRCNIKIFFVNNKKESPALEKIRASLSPTRQSISAPIGKSPASSTLFKSTKAHDTGKWKSKEEKDADYAAALASKSANGNALKVKGPSERLRSYNAAMRNGTWQKQQQKNSENSFTEVIDPREKGWNEYFIEGQIPPIESLSLDANDKPASSATKAKPKTKKIAKKSIATSASTDSGKVEEKVEESVEPVDKNETSIDEVDNNNNDNTVDVTSNDAAEVAVENKVDVKGDDKSDGIVQEAQEEVKNEAAVEVTVN